MIVRLLVFIEYIFENGDMSLPLAANAAPDPRLGELLRLRGEISRMQRRRAEATLLPLDPALEGLLPDGGLRVGAAYCIDPSPSLLGALLAPPSRKGTWCAVVGMPAVGVEALAGFGVDLARLLLVPDPGERWLTVTSVLSEVVPLVAVRPRGSVREADAARLNARLRDRGCTLLVTAPWAESQATIRLEDPEWRGLHEGWGLLEERLVTVTASLRRGGGARRVRVRLPGPEGTVAPAPPALRPIADLVEVARQRRAG